MMKETIKRKLKAVNRKKSDELSSKITNETVAEHREHILAGGRRFKYPHQYVKHKLVINTIIIGVLTVILVCLIGWWQLYLAQNTSDFMYRVTRVVPVPVASVNGELVRYSDYLMRYRSQELWLTEKGQLGIGSGDDKRQLDYYKRSVMDGLVADTYAEKRAKELNITISEDEVQTVVDNNRNTATGKISQEVYDASTKDTLGYSPDEYRHIIKQSLLRQKVMYAIDKEATRQKNALEAELKDKSNSSLQQVADKLQKNKIMVEIGASGSVPKNNLDEGRSEKARSLKVGQISSVFKATNGDGYYVVQLVSSNDRQVSYLYLHIGLTAFYKELDKVKKDNEIKEYISIPKTTTEVQKEGGN